MIGLIVDNLLKGLMISWRRNTENVNNKNVALTAMKNPDEVTLERHKKLSSLFPLSTKITYEHIRLRDTWNTAKCAGATCLRDAIESVWPDANVWISWGVHDGAVCVNIDHHKELAMVITTEQQIDFTEQITPIDVVFKIGRSL